MFGSKKTTDTSSSSASTSLNSINSLVNGTLMEGRRGADNGIRSDGQLKGILNCKGKVIVGPSGNIDGEVNCQNAVIEGTFDGILKVNELLTVRESARVTGEITAGKVNVESGAVFNVSCNTGASVKKMVTQEPIKLAN